MAKCFTCISLNVFWDKQFFSGISEWGGISRTFPDVQDVITCMFICKYNKIYINVVLFNLIASLCHTVCTFII